MLRKSSFNELENNQVKIIFFMTNRGYNANDRLEFILTVTKRDYDTINRSKLTLNKEKDHRWKKNEDEDM